MGSSDAHYLASRAKMLAILSSHVEVHYAALPEHVRIHDFAHWFRSCQWNARASLYEHFVEQIRAQCVEEKGEPCTVAEARAHLAKYLRKSERTIERYMRERPFPPLSNGNGNGNGKRGGRSN